MPWNLFFNIYIPRSVFQIFTFQWKCTVIEIQISRRITYIITRENGKEDVELDKRFDVLFTVLIA
jgi:hypothetical protein